MKRASRLLALPFLLATLASCATTTAPLEVVSTLDIQRYAGTWYEIASYPQRFQRGCVATKARYEPVADDEVRVINECRDQTFDGELRSIEGKAWIEDPDQTAAKLRVQFFWPFSGAYWVIELDPEYRYAVVGHPSRDYLWILSREPKLAEATYQNLLAKIQAKGYDLSRLQRTPQPEA